MRYSRRIPGVILVVWSLVLAPELVRAENDAEVLKRIFADWGARRRNTATVKYRLVGEEIFPRGRDTNAPELPAALKGKPFPEEDRAYPKRLTLLLDFAKNRFRKETFAYLLHFNDGRYYSNTKVQLFDGSKSKVLVRKAANRNDDLFPILTGVQSDNAYTYFEIEPDLWIAPGDSKGGAGFGYDDLPAFLAHGVVPTSCWALPERELLQMPLDSNKFYVHSRGVIGERECIVLRSRVAPDDPVQAFNDFWVDVSRQSAVLRAAMWVKGREAYVANIQYQHTPHGWLPKRWEGMHYWGAGPFLASDWLDVTEVSVNPAVDASEFDVPLRSGMIVDVQDQRQSNRYQVAGDGHTLIEWGEVMRAASSGTKSVWPWLLVAASVGLVALLPLLYYRRKRAQLRKAGSRSE